MPWNTGPTSRGIVARHGVESADREKVAKAIREILQFDVPCIGKYEDQLMVQRVDLNVDEECLVMLHYAGEVGFSRTELGKWVRFPAPLISEALKRLTSPSVRQVIVLPSAFYRLTDLGSKYIREQLADKLLIQ